MSTSDKTYKEVAPEVLHVNEPEVAYAHGTYSTIIPLQALYNRSAEEFARAVALDEAEFEDMRAHGFYAKGTPFPQQPQTDAELQSEIDAIEQEDYLDEGEYRAAISRLWNALG